VLLLLVVIHHSSPCTTVIYWGDVLSSPFAMCRF
jgi:hypothetical protein